MGDSLQTLPTDQQPMDPHEQHLLNTIFKEETSSITNLFQELRLPIIVGVLFLILSLPQWNNLLQSVIPYTNKSQSSLIVFKTFVFIIVVFILSLNKIV